MAQRLATEYVKTCLHLTEAEMLSFLEMLYMNQVNPRVKVTENGSQEVAFQDEAGDEVNLSFEKRSGYYVCEGSCRLSNPKLANLMRKAIAEFKGDAIVNRIYATFTMNYVYKRGAVMLITEITTEHQKIVFEHKDTLGQLEKLFHQRRVEQEITAVLGQIDELLDQRNAAPEQKQDIDVRLQSLAHQLFTLEA
ncbi:non-ribosomal peptide synthetase module [Paenibacillus koleovorans]|uniref:non-ribosomal peptide synthetase module n=1 Tax=Paenibacillus koleovorans TaxID=121608 RepID=UPI000FD6F443|nr:non-ribosomal peptide synthetase module [Paenibacillus koleovorans]